MTIQNVWIPSNVDPPADPDYAMSIIESNKLMVSGGAAATPGEDSYKIIITFYPDAGENDDLLLESLGVWLPYGFSYLDGSSDLEKLDIWEPAYSDPTVTNHAGGQAVVWEFASANLTYFPGVNINDNPQYAEIEFEYTANVSGAKPTCISWVTTSGAVSDILNVTWDIDTRIYKITSTAADTEIEAYGSRNELRNMNNAISGDYKAIGNSLMQDNYSPYDRRDTLLAESTTTVSDIPVNADVLKAYLYWSGWFSSGYTTAISPWPDTCGNFNNWTNTAPNTVWQISSGQFRGHYTGSDANARYLTMKDSMDLSGYASGSVLLEWDQSEGGTLESTDGLQFELSSNNGTSWGGLITAFMDDTSAEYYHYTIPDAYLTGLFKMRFYLADMSGSSEYAYIDDFAVAQITGTADTSVIFKMDGTQVYLDGNGDPQQGAQPITASSASVIGNKNRGNYSYASFLDVTKLVREYSEEGDHEQPTGNADYTVGSVSADTGEYWSYAGWSLIIVYYSPETAGHQLYLYDTFAFSGGNEDLDFDFDGEPGGTITDFLVPEPIPGETNAARLTVFVGEGDEQYSGDYLKFNGTNLSDGFSTSNVWNGQSIGMSEDGVDVDTFYVTWASGLLTSGDTTAQLNLPTGTDNWNLIYIILSLRSETHTGGTTHYFIRSS